MEIQALLSLAKRGCCEKMVEVSSSELAEDLSTSQQTASRRIKQLDDEGYVNREILRRGQRIKLTPKGAELLRQMYADLDKVFKNIGSSAYIITGEVTSGMGEGRYYMGIPGYKEQFTKKLGFEPYPGTLNLRLITPEDIKIRQTLENLTGIEIKEFSYNRRTFGAVKCFKAVIEGVEGAVVIPARTHHGLNTIEAIASKRIRSIAKLKDGDLVTVKIQ